MYRGWILIVGMALIGGCGPVTYVHQVVLKAKSSVAEARTHEAGKHAPYEYYGAKAYLKQARIRAGYGDFQVAVKYGRKSEKMAKKSVKLTKERLAEREDVGDEASGTTSGVGSDTRAVEVPQGVGGPQSDTGTKSGKGTQTSTAAEDTEDTEKEKKPSRAVEVEIPR
jgi:hypothetical protein